MQENVNNGAVASLFRTGDLAFLAARHRFRFLHVSPCPGGTRGIPLRTREESREGRRGTARVGSDPIARNEGSTLHS